MSDEQVIIYRAGRPHQAELLANLLAENGIEAIVHNDAPQAALGEVPFGWATSVRVVVRAEDAARAREIAIDFDRQLFGNAHSQPNEVGAPQAEPSETDKLDRCPSCGKPRMTTCPFCKTSSATFPASTGPDRNNDHADTIVVCSVCDEPFRPTYLKVCEWCGHEFPDGSQPLARTEPTEPIEFNERMLVVIIGTVAVVVATIGYFAWLLRE